MFSTPLRDQSNSLIHILFVLCKRFRLMSLKFYCLVIHISHKTLEISCAWSKGSGERLQGHHGPLVIMSFLHWNNQLNYVQNDVQHIFCVWNFFLCNLGVSVRKFSVTPLTGADVGSLRLGNLLQYLQ